MKKVGIYVHIPFCKQKCKYCDFVSFQCMEDKEEEYFSCLIEEIVDKSKELKNDKISVDTIYIGGGTPSIVKTGYVQEIINTIFDNYKVEKNAEITIEVNTMKRELTELVLVFNLQMTSY